MIEEQKKQDIKKEVLEQVGLSSAVVWSFDTTGSMYPCIAEVRSKLKELATQMFKDIPGLKMGLIAHGDYCDKSRAISVLDLTDDLDTIMNFIQDTPNTSGGDEPECYELALNRAASLSWPESGGTFVLIGDASPHDANYPGNTDHLDWKKELKSLQDKKIKVFSLQCLKASYNTDNNNFWSSVAELSGTPLLVLESFGDSAGTLGAACYSTCADAATYDAYEEKAVACNLVSTAGMSNFSALRSYRTENVSSDKTVPIEVKDAE